MKIGFIGVGNMASILIASIMKNNRCPAGNLVLFDLDTEKCAEFAKKGAKIAPSAEESTREADILFLAVKPQNMSELLPTLKNYSAEKCFVSIAAGVSTSYIKSQLDPTAAVIRVMPNTPMLIGCGAAEIAEGGEEEAPYFETVVAIFKDCSLVEILPEEKMNAGIALNGSSPAIFYKVIADMIAYGEQNGIDAATARRLAAKTMEGAAKMILEQDEPIETLISRVTSKGGTTIATLEKMDACGFSDALQAGLEACKNRAEELCK